MGRVAVTRELPSDRLALRIEPPGGEPKRWAEDEIGAQDVLSDLAFSDEMPGGCKDASGTLARDPRINYSDIQAFSKAYIYEPGGEKVWEGYFDKSPESSGDHLSLGASLVGNQKHLEGNKSIKLGFINSNLTAWRGMSNSRKVTLLGAGWKVGDASVDTDPVGLLPSLAFVIEGAFPKIAIEAWFDGEGIPLRKLRFDRISKSSIGVGNPAAFFGFYARFGNDDVGGGEATVDLHTVGEQSEVGAEHYHFDPVGKRFVAFDWELASPNDDGFNYNTYLRNLKVIADHNLPLKGTWPNVGFTAKQMLEYGVPLFAAPLTCDPEFMDDDQYVIQHAWYPDSNMGDVTKDVTKYSLYDWFVYFDELFQYRSQGSYGRFWKAYVGQSNLEEQGLDSERLWESVVVQFQDVDGTTRTVGPPGSGATYTDARLQITDPDHPAVKAELTRRDILDLRGIGTPETAIAVGVRFLEEANLLPRSGQATLSGYVMDSAGNLRPAAQVRSGDWISFVDAQDTSYRKIVNKAYTHANRGAQIDVDAPPSGLEALLERLQAVLIPLGLG